MAKKAPRLGSASETEPVVRRSERIRFRDVGPPLRGPQLGIMEGRICLCKLPEKYRSFLRKHNGGVPDPSAFRWVHRAEGERLSHIDRLFGFDPRPLDDPRRDVDCFHAALKYRDLLPCFSLPIGFVNRDDLLLIFEHGSRHGHVWIKIMREVPVFVEETPDPEAGLHFVAKSFDGFLRLLHRDPQEEA